jgi:hypothetical protein
MFCALACVLLIMLWVRSNHRLDELRLPFPSSSQLVLQSFGGTIWVHPEYGSQSPESWGLRSKSVEELSRLTGFELIPPRATFSMSPDELRLPYWFLAPAFATSAAAAWLPWRFTLRTLLIAVTLVSVVLGFVVWAANR